MPNKLAAQVAVFDAQPELGIVHSGWRRVTQDGDPLTDVEPWHHTPRLNLENWLRWKPILPSAMMFRRSWLERAGGFDPQLHQAEDTDLVLRLAYLGCKADWLRQITVCYRQHGQSAFNQSLAQARSLEIVIDRVFAQPELPVPVRMMENHIRYNTFVWIAWLLYHTGSPKIMVQYLQRSWPYTPYSTVETIVNWLESFSQFTRGVGGSLDADALGQSPEWQQLMHWVLDSPKC
ncbi:glycosyltransferase family 2 protein [Neosynechococcus sphagnicola]|uniref:glycosyltransferase family 2 protein n=1 Tax=Neosynechococcus sphagnicola TaxID=1501145 RepID=UPI001955449C|nr:glycosyltransferase family 2 protein [Neosynechococcus sphagnicola]